MSFSRLFLPLLFAFTLLFAQQGGITHALNHTLAEQSQAGSDQPENNQQEQHSQASDHCASYAQLGGALNSTLHSYASLTTSTASVAQFTIAFNSTPVVAAYARGPPTLQTIA